VEVCSFGCRGKVHINASFDIRTGDAMPESLLCTICTARGGEE
jgi:hypothetical protein